MARMCFGTVTGAKKQGGLPISCTGLIRRSIIHALTSAWVIPGGTDMKFTSAAKMVAMGTAATVGVTSAASANSDVEGLYAGFGLNGWNGGIGDDSDPL